MAGDAGALALLHACAAAPAEEARPRVLRALTRFPFDRDVWLTIGPTAIAIADVDPGQPGRLELVSALATLPLRSARRRLEQIAADPADPERAVAAALLAPPEERTRQRVAELVHELADDPLGDAVEALACLPIERYGVDARLFEPAFASDAAEPRMWAAIALGRLGDLEPITSVFAEIRAGQTPPFMWGNPWSTYDHLARARPLPDNLREHLLAVAESPDIAEGDPGLFVSALTGIRDADGYPIGDEHSSIDTPSSVIEEADGADARESRAAVDPAEVARLLLHPDRRSRISPIDESDPAWLSALAQLDADVAGRIVTKLIRQVNRADDLADTLAGNRVMTIVEAFPPGYRLRVDRVVASYLDAAPPRMDRGQFCFALARADLDAVLAGFAHLLVADRHHPLHRRLHSGRTPELLDLLDGVAAMSTGTFGPRIGAGPSSSPSEAPPQQYFDDLDEQMVGAEPPEVGNGDPSDRALRVDVGLPREAGPDVTVTQAFVAGQRHRVAVWIGHQRDARPTTISSGTAFDESAVEREPGRFTELEVTLAHLDVVETKALYLPNDRSESSRPCEFDLFVRADERIVSATIVVSQQRRALEQFVLLGPAGSTGDSSPLGPIVLEQQVLARSYEQAGPPTPFNATVVRPRGDAPHVLLTNGSSSVVAPWKEGVRETVRIVAARLYDAARAKAAGEGENDWVELLRLLAAQGTRLHSWLEDNGYGDLAAGGRIQLLDADPTEPLPVEIVYDRGGVADDAVPCPNWAAALERGTCEGCETRPTFRGPYICPLGFWGLSTVIERQTGTGEPPRLGRLHPLGSVLFAASGHGVLDSDYERTLGALGDVLGTAPTTASSWEEWPDLVRQHAPTLIVVLPHQDRDPALEVDYLEIGRSSRLRAGEVTVDFVKRPDGPDPVVLLLGCRTADASVSYQNFVAEFRRSGAAIVVGTLATVLGQDAAPIAQQFVRELAGSRREQVATEPCVVGFGEAMRTVRRRMVADGNPAALGLIAFGDSDWLVEVGT